VNHVVADNSLLAEATAFARKVATGATRAHAAHKALLRSWAVGGIAAADQVMFDVAMPLFESADAKTALASAVAAFQAGQPRPVLEFKVVDERSRSRVGAPGVPTSVIMSSSRRASRRWPSRSPCRSPPGRSARRSR